MFHSSTHPFSSCSARRVGGIPEVLPERFLYFVQPDAVSIESGLAEAIEDVADGRRPAKRECHEVGASVILDKRLRFQVSILTDRG